MNFYAAGKTAALQKLGFGGFLKSVGEAWKGMSPAAQGLTKRLGAGAAVGGGTGALLGGEGNRGTGALLGGAAGALGMGALGHHMQGRATKSLAKDLWEGATQTSAGRARPAAKAMERLEAMKPVYQQGEQYLQSRLFPGMGRL